jgi:3',5'-cyclic AMP phosphodiesterase CpdA
MVGRCRLLWLSLLIASCNPDAGDVLLPARDSDPINFESWTLVARLVHITDTHVVDEESPARFAQGHLFTESAWRPHESYSTQLLDGIIRTANRIHVSGRTIDFLVHTGDTCDNAQSNELAWMIGVLEGETIDPLTGPDDRLIEDRPEPEMDPHADFVAQGLYQADRHGDLPSIPWYVVFGNHDTFSIGLFPIVESPEGGRTALLPLACRPGTVLPVVFDPSGAVVYGKVTPANPGPPVLFQFPSYVEPNAARAYFSKPEFIQAMSQSASEPVGHGFGDAVSGSRWYSVSPVPGLRLIGLDTADVVGAVPGMWYPDGSISAEQLAFLRAQLDAAADMGEIVIVASHHPSSALRGEYGSAVVAAQLRELLDDYPNLVLHICGHHHRNRVMDRAGYVEIETCSTLDLPQEGRLMEIWRDDADGSIAVAYEMFSHINDRLPVLGDDPLRGLREVAQTIALGDKGAAARQSRLDPSGADPRGEPADREGVFISHP